MSKAPISFRKLTNNIILIGAVLFFNIYIWWTYNQSKQALNTGSANIVIRGCSGIFEVSNKNRKVEIPPASGDSLYYSKEYDYRENGSE